MILHSIDNQMISQNVVLYTHAYTTSFPIIPTIEI